MISLDTNVILRYVLRDIPDQSRHAQELITESICFVSDVVLTEVAFVMEKVMDVSRNDVAQLLKNLIDLETVNCDEELLREVIDLYSVHKNLSFPDCYLAIQAKQNGYRLATFDKALIKNGGDHVYEPKFLT